MAKITIYNKSGVPYSEDELRQTSELAKRFGALEDKTPHGLTPKQIEALDEKGQQMLGGVYNLSNMGRQSSLLEESLPKGRQLDSRSKGRKSAQMFGGGGGAGGWGTGNGASVTTTALPYLPEFALPTRQSFPIHRRLANTYWRMFFKMDPVIGAVISMLAELPWGDFQLAGEGVDGEIKEVLEYMISECNLKTMFQYFVREYLVTGECIPQLH